jgi:hypothetical protein
MTPHDRKKLERIAKDIESALATVRDLLTSDEMSIGRGQISEFDPTAEVAQLRLLDRSTAESRLNELKQQELGAVFVQSGGPSADRKKPKVWLAERILWQLFDFERGHEAIRGRGET